MASTGFLSNECIVLVAFLFIMKNGGIIDFTQLLIITSFLSTTSLCGTCGN